MCFYMASSWLLIQWSFSSLCNSNDFEGCKIFFLITLVHCLPTSNHCYCARSSVTVTACSSDFCHVESCRQGSSLLRLPFQMIQEQHGVHSCHDADMFYCRRVYGEQWMEVWQKQWPSYHLYVSPELKKNVSLHFCSSVVFGQFRMLELFPWQPGRNRTRPFLGGKAVKGHFTIACLLGRSETIEN